MYIIVQPGLELTYVPYCRTRLRPNICILLYNTA